jgi:hypothetical protein
MSANALADRLAKSFATLRAPSSAPDRLIASTAR